MILGIMDLLYFTTNLTSIKRQKKSNRGKLRTPAPTQKTYSYPLASILILPIIFPLKTPSLPTPKPL